MIESHAINVIIRTVPYKRLFQLAHACEEILTHRLMIDRACSLSFMKLYVPMISCASLPDIGNNLCSKAGFFSFYTNIGSKWRTNPGNSKRTHSKLLFTSCCISVIDIVALVEVPSLLGISKHGQGTMVFDNNLNVSLAFPIKCIVLHLAFEQKLSHSKDAHIVRSQVVHFGSFHSFWRS